MPRPEVKTERLPAVCFAPALTDEKLVNYRIAADLLGLSPIKDALNECLKAIEAWWKLPDSTREDVDRFRIKHQGADKTFSVVPLEEKHIKELWELVPWDYELNAMQSLFDGIPSEQKELRDMAFHILWHARELCLDREPLTQDKL